MKSISKTNTGSKPTNKDFHFAGENLFIVCDGVDSSPYGDIASKLACSSFSDYFKQNPATVYDCDYLNKALHYTIQQFKETESKYPEMKGMSTTVVLIAFDKVGAITGWLGDSRLYHIRKNEILFITDDHSLINELRKQGETDVAKLKNIRNFITKSVSTNTKHEFSCATFWESEIQKGDFFFLCSDGVLENITNEILCAELTNENSLEEKAQKIFSHCEGKTRDNFTFQIIEA